MTECLTKHVIWCVLDYVLCIFDKSIEFKYLSALVISRSLDLKPVGLKFKLLMRFKALINDECF